MLMRRFRMTLAQMAPVVGNLAANAGAALRAQAVAKAQSADLVVLPEMFLTGYQTQDLVQKPAFQADVAKHLAELTQAAAGSVPMLIGAPVNEGGQLFNALFYLKDGEARVVTRKHYLPNEDVFDEKRLFAQGPLTGPFDAGGIRIGAPICEDAWHRDVVETMVESGAELLIVPNGSPYRRDKQDLRINLMVGQVVSHDVPLVYLNMLGGQDDQVFDGASFVLNPGGKLAVQLPAFDESIIAVDFIEGAEGWRAETGLRETLPDAWELDYRAMVIGLADYLAKCGFSKVLLGLSGGIDSALVAAIAADALGPENVRCVMMPSEYTSQHSLDDAADVAHALGCQHDMMPISGARAAIGETLAPLFVGAKPDLTEENIQSRLRGLLLMALSNKFGEMLLTTGNKSEVAVGYATIYGDMAGGYNPLKDLYKTRVFETCRWRNANHRPWMKGPAGVVIPPRVIDKPPSAELRADQKDSDSLPPYDVLDAILDCLIDLDLSVAETVARGYDRDIVKRVEKLIYLSEYKRFQSAPGTRLTKRAFWLDRRYPMVNQWRDPS